LPNRQPFVNPAGIGIKSEVFGIFDSDIYLLPGIVKRHSNNENEYRKH
jgi:hypothetical protein